MLPETFLSVLNACPFPPEPRHAETIELDLSSMLSMEESAARDEANLSAVREWLHIAYLNT